MSIVTLPQDLLDNICYQLEPNDLNNFLWVLNTQKKEQKKKLMSIFIPIKIFKELYGSVNEKMYQEFESDICSLKGKERLEYQFDFLKEIEDIFSRSTRFDSKEIVWNGEKIGNKRKFKYNFRIIPFWNRPLNEIKNKNNFMQCGCVPYCWRCLKKVDPFNLIVGDHIICRANENNRFYKAKIISMEIIGKAIIRFSPYLGEPLLDYPQQEVCLNEIYNIPNCWSSYIIWQDNNPIMTKRICHKIYDVHFSYAFMAKRIARTALALI